MALKEAIKELIFLKGFFTTIYFLKGKYSPILMTDSQSAIALAKNPVYHKRSKHIDIQYHFVREHTENGNIQLEYAPTESQLADALTKPVDNTKWEQFTSSIGMNEATNTNKA